MVDDASRNHIIGLYREAHDLLEEVQRDAKPAHRAAYSFAMEQTDKARRHASVALAGCLL